MGPLREPRSVTSACLREVVGVESNPVPVHDLLDVSPGVAPAFEDRDKQLVIRDGIDFTRRAVYAALPVGIAADRRMIGIAGKLAHVIDMIGHVVQRNFLAPEVVPAVVSPGVRQSRVYHGQSIQVSMDAPMTPPLSMTIRSCSSENWRWPGTRARQF